MSDQPGTGEADGTNGVDLRKRRLLLLLVPVLALAVLGAAFFAWWLAAGRWESETDDAYVGGDIVAVTPLTGGTDPRRHR